MFEAFQDFVQKVFLSAASPCCMSVLCCNILVHTLRPPPLWQTHSTYPLLTHGCAHCDKMALNRTHMLNHFMPQKRRYTINIFFQCNFGVFCLKLLSVYYEFATKCYPVQLKERCSCPYRATCDQHPHTVSPLDSCSAFNTRCAFLASMTNCKHKFRLLMRKLDRASLSSLKLYI